MQQLSAALSAVINSSPTDILKNAIRADAIVSLVGTVVNDNLVVVALRVATTSVCAFGALSAVEEYFGLHDTPQLDDRVNELIDECLDYFGVERGDGEDDFKEGLLNIGKVAFKVLGIGIAYVGMGALIHCINPLFKSDITTQVQSRPSFQWAEFTQTLQSLQVVSLLTISYVPAENGNSIDLPIIELASSVAALAITTHNLPIYTTTDLARQIERVKELLGGYESKS